MLVFYLAALENEGERRQFSELYTRYYCQMAAVAAGISPAIQPRRRTPSTTLSCKLSSIFQKFLKFPATKSPSGSFPL